MSPAHQTNAERWDCRGPWRLPHSARVITRADPPSAASGRGDGTSRAPGTTRVRLATRRARGAGRARRATPRRRDTGSRRAPCVASSADRRSRASAVNWLMVCVWKTHAVMPAGTASSRSGSRARPSLATRRGRAARAISMAPRSAARRSRRSGHTSAPSHLASSGSSRSGTVRSTPTARPTRGNARGAAADPRRGARTRAAPGSEDRRSSRHRRSGSRSDPTSGSARRWSRSRGGRAARRPPPAPP